VVRVSLEEIRDKKTWLSERIIYKLLAANDTAAALLLYNLLQYLKWVVFQAAFNAGRR
jgi:hypothetical protein